MKNELMQKIFIGLFTVLYAMTGLVSVWHAVGFFSIANPGWMAWVLALVFEVGQAAVLFSILAGGRGWVSWGLMAILTVVQVMGNVYSCYSEVMKNTEKMIYFSGPFFGPDNTLSPETQAVIIAYIMGAILPVVALCLTAVVSRYIICDEKIKSGETQVILPIENESKSEMKTPKSEPGYKVFIDN